MDLQNKILEKIGVDKILHLLVLSYISLVLFLLSSILISMIVSVIVILLKEIIDKYVRKGNFDLYDILYGAFGIIVSLIIYLII